MKAYLISVALVMITANAVFCSESRDSHCAESQSALKTYPSFSSFPANCSWLCCIACESDTKCNAWYWDSVSENCALMEGEATSLNTTVDDQFMSDLSNKTEPEITGGLYEDPVITTTAPLEYPSEYQAVEEEPEELSSTVAAEKSSDQATVPACAMTKNNVYQVSSFIKIISDVSDIDCCILCSRNPDCYCWNWFKKDGQCFLSSETGPLVKQKGAKCGSTVGSRKV